MVAWPPHEPPRDGAPHFTFEEENWSRAVSVKTSKYGALGPQRPALGVQMWKYGRIEVWSVGGALQARGRGDMESSPALESRCKRSDVEVWRAPAAHCRCVDAEGGLEARCTCCDVKTWRYRALEL